MRTHTLSTAAHNGSASCVSRAGVPSRSRWILLRSFAVCLAAVAVQQAAHAQILPAGPITGTIVWNDTANWAGGVITNTTTGSFSGNPTFQFSGPYTVSSTIVLTQVANQTARSSTFAASTGTQTLTFNANTGFTGNQNNYSTNSIWASSLIWNLSSGTVTYTSPTVRTTTLASKITGNGTLRIVGDTGRTDSFVYLTNTANDWTGDLINDATLNLAAGNGVPSGVGFGSFINGNSGQFFTQSTPSAANGQNLRVNNLSGAGLVLYGNATTVTSTISVLSLVSSTYAGGIVNSILDRNRGAMSLVKDGAATLTLSGTTNWYNGITDVRSGTLDIRSIADAGVSLASNAYTASGTVYTPTSMAGIRIGMRVFYDDGTNDSTATYVTATTDTTFILSRPLTSGKPYRLGFGAPLGMSTSDTSNLVFSGGNLRYSGGISGSTNRLFSIGTGGGGIVADGTTGVLSFTGGGTIGFNGQSGARTFTLSGANTGTNTLTTALADNGGATSLVKAGVGRWVLGGSHAYTGSTIVNDGSLLVNGTLGNTAVTVNSAGLLGGSGRINGSVSVLSGGTFSPGMSPGVLTIGSSLTLAGTTLMEIDGTTRATQYDGADVNGALTYGGAMSIVFNSSLTSAYADNTEFDFFNFTSQSGSFTSITTASNGAYYGGLTFTQTPGGDKWTATKASQTLEFTQSTGNLVIVPEPLTLGLLGIGSGASILGYRRLRRRNRGDAA